jgi:hypothetical protein
MSLLGRKTDIMFRRYIQRSFAMQPRYLARAPNAELNY